MAIKVSTPDEYINSLPDDRKNAMQKLRKVIKDNLPKGFEETINYNMIGYVVPHSMYPDGYHCDRKLPLPFMNIASQKNYIAVYHMGIYTDEKLLNWFTSAYAKHTAAKLDMGKSCIRFKKTKQIPFELIGELASKVSPEAWINTYEANVKR